MKIGNFLEICHKNMENYPFYGNISMEIGSVGKFPCLYGDMPREGGDSGKSCSDIQQSCSRGCSLLRLFAMQ
jgi:hypothetical protein